MPRPSIIQQLPKSIQVAPEKLLPSPRHWNAGMIRFKEELLLAYRHHRRDANSRCAIGICSLNEKTFQPTGPSQLLPLEGVVGGEHFEDARLFIFQGELHISYTEMRGYRPGVGYECMMKYARLKKVRGKWRVMEDFQPKYGQNTGYSKEKNWVFFESNGKLHCIYQGSPRHIVLEIGGNYVENEYISEAPHWAWGEIRGGATPLKMPKGFLHVFHSSIPSEDAPHYVRYFAGAYTFDEEPPFAPRFVSAKPIAAGSEEDGHQVDPRYVEGWKPYVVFPCGLIYARAQNFYVSMGVNDWQTVISPLSVSQLHLTKADGTDIKPRYLRTDNGSRTENVIALEVGQYRQEWLTWEVPSRNGPGMSGVGYMRLTDERVAEELLLRPHIEEIEEDTYLRATGALIGR